MKIGEPRPINRMSNLSRAGSASPASAADSASDNVRAISDTVSVMGIPKEEMTPKVRDAIMTLMQEVDSLRRDLDTAKRRMDELESLADRDTLTPVANRRAFVREMTRMISFAERYDVPSSLIFVDVNDLKVINDTHGHAAGDAALQHVAATLQENVRDSDVVGRLGGDEFGVILANAQEDIALQKAGHLADKIGSTPFTWQGRELRVSVAHGAYSFRAGIDASRALEEADREMYARKKQLKSTDSL